ncbi:MAG: mannitol dehydrogenase [Clostridia bacterium]|nr:mannitol dehydrogenase [Clostridia bacterium]
MKKFVMYGAGNIGRGFIGQTFSKSGYEVVFVDVNREMVDKFNNDGKYPVKIVSPEGKREEWVSGIRAVNGMEADKVAEEIATCDIMGTAVGVNILPRIAKPLAEGIVKRLRMADAKPLNVIICENLLDANIYLRKLVGEFIPEDLQQAYAEKIGFVEASIGRMVPIVTPEMQEGNILRVWVEEYCELPVDRAGFVGEPPADVQGLMPFTPFEFFIQRKLFIHNMGHAISAFLGARLGCEAIWQAMGVPAVKLLAMKAMMQSAAALSKEHGVPLADVLRNVEDLIYRFSNRDLGDTVARVGRDPIRKLNENDRLVGAYNLCKKLGLPATYIRVGIAAALCFEEASDAAAVEVSTFAKENGTAAALAKYCNLTDPADAQAIDVYVQMLRNGQPLEELLAMAERETDRFYK